MKAKTPKQRKNDWDAFFKGDIDHNEIPTREFIISLLTEKSNIKDKQRVRDEIEDKTEKFISEARKVWPKEEFNYSHTVFYGRGIIVIHKDFGPAWQRPEAHLKKVFPFGNKAFPLRKEMEIVLLNTDMDTLFRQNLSFGVAGWRNR